MIAKRTAAGLGAGIGFSLEGIDDLNIAVAQACERAIHASDRTWGPGEASLKLSFELGEGGIQVDVQVQPEREAVARRVAAQELAQRRSEQASLDVEAVAVDMIRAFVDELRCNVDPRGGVRMRMVKYVVD